jgi:hypothetical protein
MSNNPSNITEAEQAVRERLGADFGIVKMGRYWVPMRQQDGRFTAIFPSSKVGAAPIQSPSFDKAIDLVKAHLGRSLT